MQNTPLTPSASDFTTAANSTVAVEQNLRALGITLPTPPAPVASYIPAVQSGNLLIISGQLPFHSGQLLSTGPVPSVVSIDQATLAARQCLINILAIAKAELNGDWSRLVRTLRLGVFVLCDPLFDQQPKIANGASDLLVQILGPAGRHARAAVGTSALPLNSTVEIEAMFEITPLR